ncbi:MAG: phosphoribosylamine--glycine ligase [Bacteroidia bacterium]|jgi:phosphoribosylamine--glycine ligase|nr:phosphoribosylamine--glycine ligase [Bacteroidia bacterium]
MNILLIGSGGREHAFAYKLTQSKQCDKLFVMPGNAGTSQVAINVPLNPLDFALVGKFCLDNEVQLIVVGPEEPLVKGMRDYFMADDHLKRIPFIGPDEQGAQLEGSKDFSKNFMQRYQIPTAAYRTFTFENIHEGIDYVKTHSLPVVLKADGLAAGKGVLICQTNDEAVAELEAMIKNQKFGAASSKVVVEAFLNGIELSVFVLTDGKHYKILPAAKDYKRIGEGDTGLNTGGMGAVSPVPFADDVFMKKVEERIVKPTISGLVQEGINYVGFVFIGLMNVNGDPWVIEYNCRMGDPETEVVLPRIESDFVDLMLAAGTGNLNQFDLQISNQTATTVMLVSEGYPGDYAKGYAITGFEHVHDSIVFHAGTKTTDDQQTVTNGGRVLAITSMGGSIKEAVAKSFANAERIQYQGKYYRRDIGYEFT